MIIRKGGKSDILQLYQLIKELAEYEKEPNAVIATIEEYKQAWEEGIFEFIVGIIDDKIIGIALYYLTFSTWKGRMLYLEDFVITEAYRKKGYGQVIFDAVVDEAKNKKCALLKWQVLDWNTPALSFYEKNKAEIEQNWWNGKIVLRKS
jgi:GNAT superfamily N-acetyltransferase